MGEPTIYRAEDGTLWVQSGNMYPDGFYVSSVTGGRYEFTETNHSCERKHGPLTRMKLVPMDEGSTDE